MLSTKHLTDSALATMTIDAKVLEEDSLGPKVYRLSNGHFLKLFRRKRLISSALLRPYSVRFYQNAERLAELGIPTLTPITLYTFPEKQLSAVLYTPLPGQTLKELYLQNPESFITHLPALCDFIRELHRKGIYFRSLHLGNIVLTPQDTLGLIDVADLAFHRRSLSKAKAARNLKHFARLLRQMEIAGRFPMAELSAAVLAD